MLRAGTAIGAGVVLALAATIAPLPPPAEVPGASLAVRLPSIVQTLVLALLAVSALLLIALQRPRRPAEDDPIPARAPRRTSAWTALLSALPFVVLFGAAWYYVAYRGPDEGHPIERAITAISGLADRLALGRKPATSIAWVDYTIAALVLAAALAIFALMLLVTFAERIEKWWTARDGDAPMAAAREAAAGLGDPRFEPDPRAAVILAWAWFERALVGAGAPRAPGQTPAELGRAALARLGLPRPPVERLTALFEVARFSDRPLGADAREAACACLDTITTALAEDPAHAR